MFFDSQEFSIFDIVVISEDVVQSSDDDACEMTKLDQQADHEDSEIDSHDGIEN